jgi:predicted transcriptional regulator
MKKSILKRNATHVTEIIDCETGEIIESNVKHHTYIANSKEEFLLLYVNALPIFRGVSNPAKSVYAYLLERYNAKTVFELGGAMRGLMSKELHFASSTIANALTELVESKLLYSKSKALYQINPRYAFKGSTSERNEALKAIIELGCKDC